MYKDTMGRDLKVEFSFNGINNDIPVCMLFVKAPAGFMRRESWERVHMKGSTASIQTVSKWSSEDYEAFAKSTIRQYNDDVVAREIVDKKMKSINKH